MCSGFRGEQDAALGLRQATVDPVTVARGLSGYSLLSYVYSGEPHLVVVRNKWLHLTTLGMVPGRWETLGKRCLFSL